MPHIRPTGEQINRLVTAPDDQPVVMLNLLRFAKVAHDDASKSGAEEFETYGRLMQDILAKHGAKALWRGSVDQVVIGDDDADAWDMVALVEYPSRKAFMDMNRSDEYRGVGQHRTNALIDSRLIACKALPLPPK